MNKLRLFINRSIILNCVGFESINFEMPPPQNCPPLEPAQLVSFSEFYQMDYLPFLELNFSSNHICCQEI